MSQDKLYHCTVPLFLWIMSHSMYKTTHLCRCLNKKLTQSLALVWVTITGKCISDVLQNVEWLGWARQKSPGHIFWYKWFITTDALFTPYWFYFSSNDLSCWSSFVGLVSTRSARVYALCSRYALSSPMHKPIGRQVLAPAQWDICFA